MFSGIKRRIITQAHDISDAVRSMSATVNPHAIIVLGNQKSGTSAIAALLSEMTGLTATLDIMRQARRPTLQRIRTDGMTMAQFISAHKLEFSRRLVKEPGLSVFYDELKGCLPDAKYIMVMRDPRDNIRSILNRHKFPGNQPDLTSEQWAQLSPAWRNTYDCSWLGLDRGSYIEMAATRWNFIADSYLANSDDIYLARYETFLEDKVGAIRQAARAMGLEEKHDIAHRVDVPFQPRGQRNVNLAEFFGDNLRRIEDICDERMKAFNYERTT